MKAEARISNITSRFNDADEEHIAHLSSQAYDAGKQESVEAVIAASLQGYFDAENISAVLSGDDMQIRIDTLLRDIAYQVAAREYAIEIDNQNVEGDHHEF